MNSVVIFTKTNAVLLENITDVTLYKRMPHAVINPSLWYVYNVPTKYWIRKCATIVPMTQFERNLRDQQIIDLELQYNARLTGTVLPLRRYFLQKVAAVTLIVLTLVGACTGLLL